jgi:hypothetical protein
MGSTESEQASGSGSRSSAASDISACVDGPVPRNLHGFKANLAAATQLVVMFKMDACGSCWGQTDAVLCVPQTGCDLAGARVLKSDPCASGTAIYDTALFIGRER